jgi:hypothetical protein
MLNTFVTSRLSAAAKQGSRASVFALAMVSASSAMATSGAAGGILHMRCTNPVGGATWSIAVDLDRQLVDTRPAKISDRWISWRDEHGGTYDLERATGKLQLRAASTTGGYFLHYSCQRE